jgi:Mn-dependent DtxR family transcriptional regulator
MPTLPILIEVEAEAVGPMLILLKRTAGVVKFHVVLDDEEKAPLLPPGGRHTGSKEATLALFVERGGGPLRISDVSRAIGGSRSRAHGALHYLKRDGTVRRIGNGLYQFSPRAMKMLVPVLALPAPSKTMHARTNGQMKVKRGPSGMRASPGGGPRILRELLTHGGMSPGEIKAGLAEHGISINSASGVLDRGKRDGLVKKVGDKYELTAKGRREEPAAQAEA